jgi:hypothetical protein
MKMGQLSTFLEGMRKGVRILEKLWGGGACAGQTALLERVNSSYNLVNNWCGIAGIKTMYIQVAGSIPDEVTEFFC